MSAPNSNKKSNVEYTTPEKPTNKDSNNSIESLMERLARTLSCTPNSNKRQKVEINDSETQPSLASISQSFSGTDDEEEDKTLQTMTKKKCKFHIYDSEEQTWSRRSGVCTALLGKDLRKGINYGVAWLIIKSSDGTELLSHAVEPKHFFRHEDTNLKRFIWRERDVMYCLVFKDEMEGLMWKDKFSCARSQTYLAWCGTYEDKRSSDNVTLRKF